VVIADFPTGQRGGGPSKRGPRLGEPARAAPPKSGPLRNPNKKRFGVGRGGNRTRNRPWEV
jgi:hypothetical protein